MPPAQTPNRHTRGSFTLVSVPVGGGSPVPLRVHWTLLLALPWFAAGFAPAIAQRGEARVASWALGALLALALFGSVALHELAHTVAGLRLGARVRSITLMFLGGVSEMSQPPSTPRGEMLMAGAGPALSLLLAALFVTVARFAAGILHAMLVLIAQLNLVIGVFNLLPAYPLDGGRVLRGALTVRLGHRRATRTASVIGRAVALVLGVLGLIGGLPFVVIVAVFVFLAASVEARIELIHARLEGVPVLRLMETVPTIEASATVEEAAERFSWARRPRLLVERDGAAVGVLFRERVLGVPWAQRARVDVSLLMEPVPDAVDAQAPVGEAYRRMNELQVEELPVVEAGRLSGVLRLDAIERFAMPEDETVGRDRTRGRDGDVPI